MADSNSTPEISSLETWQRYLDQDHHGDQIAHEAMNEHEEERNLWNFMEQWEAQQQQPQPIVIYDNETMDVNNDDESLQVGGQLAPLPPLFDF